MAVSGLDWPASARLLADALALAWEADGFAPSREWMTENKNWSRIEKIGIEDPADLRSVSWSAFRVSKKVQGWFCTLRMGRCPYIVQNQSRFPGSPYPPATVIVNQLLDRLEESAVPPMTCEDPYDMMATLLVCADMMEEQGDDRLQRRLLPFRDVILGQRTGELVTQEIWWSDQNGADYTGRMQVMENYWEKALSALEAVR